MPIRAEMIAPRQATPSEPRPVPSVLCKRILVGTLLALVALPGAVAIAGSLGPNPANDPRLVDEPLKDYRYDYAERCVTQPRDGAIALSRWMDRHLRGEPWGIVRCSRLGSGWSVHSEGRAIDWRLDAGITSEKRSAMRFIDMLLEDDERGRSHALARRMGVQGLIFNCKSWWSGQSDLGATATATTPTAMCVTTSIARRPTRTTSTSS